MILQKFRRAATAANRWLYESDIKSVKGLTLPNFLGLGPGQSGSTWLFEQLSLRPDIFIPSNKELNYFDRNLHRYTLDHYAAHFKQGIQQICGEISPGYSILRADRVKFLRKLMPETRLILTIRNPIDRSWSAARRVMDRFRFDLDDLNDHELYNYFSKEWAYRLPTGESMTGDYEPGLLEGHYSRVIQHWLRFFPEEQLLLVFFKQLEEQPEYYLNKICRHIGVDTNYNWDTGQLHKKVNPNPGRQLPERFRVILEELYGSEIAWIRQQFGNDAI